MHEDWDPVECKKNVAQMGCTMSLKINYNVRYDYKPIMNLLDVAEFEKLTEPCCDNTNISVFFQVSPGHSGRFNKV